MLRLIPSIVIASLLAGCAGADSTYPRTPAASKNGAPGTAQLTILIPSKTAGAIERAVKYVSPSTQSLSITINGGANAQIVNVTPGSAGCTTTSGGTSCVVSVAAPSGNDTFNVRMFDSINGQGTNLGSASASATIVSNQTNNVALTLSAVVGSLAVTLSTATPEIGLAQAIGVNVQAKDPDGNPITGAGNYTTPITLTNSDTSGTTTLSTTSVISIGQQVTLSYNGAKTGAITIGAGASGVAPSAITAAQLTPINTVPRNNGTKYVYSLSLNSQTVILATPAPSQSPLASPTPFVATYSVTNSYTVPSTFNGASGLIDRTFQATGTSANVSTKSFQSDRWYQTAQQSGSLLFQYLGYLNTSPRLVTYLGTTYSITHHFMEVASAPLTVEAFPQINGATLNEAYGATQTLNDTLPAGFPTNFSVVTASTNNFKADGSYAYNATYQSGSATPSPGTIESLAQTLRPDGSGFSNITGAGYTDDFTFTVNGSTLTQTEVYTNTGQAPVTTTTVFPSFYPTPFTLWSDNAVTTTGVAIPAACNLASSFGTLANQLTETFYLADGTGPFTSSSTDIVYIVPGQGAVCELLTGTDTFTGSSASTYNYVYTLQSSTLTAAARRMQSAEMVRGGLFDFREHVNELRMQETAQRHARTEQRARTNR